MKEIKQAALLLLLLAVLLAFLNGCATIATKGIDEDGNNFIKLRGLGKAEFPDGSKIEGEPLLKIPEVPVTYKKD